MKTIFKHISKAVMMLLLSSALYAQVPQQFNYQGIARDAKGNPISKQRLSVKLSVLPTADAGQAEYEEVQSVTTNDFGLYSLQIGNGQALFGEMKNVKWETGNKYIRVAIDPQGGSDYVDLGTTQLLSVPYAIYADRAGSTKNGSNTRALNNFIEKTDGSGNVNATSQIFDNGTNIGIGTTSPSARVHVNANAASVLEHIRMQNTNANGAGRFTMYSDGANNYSTFTKYGSTYPGAYPGLAGLYPYANLLAFGNNGLTSTDGLGRFLVSSGGNIGLSLFKSGTSRLKIHIDYATERVGIGNNIAPAAPVHISNANASDTMKFTNSTMGHTATDGFEIRTNGNNARLINRENAFLLLGTNNTDRLAINGAGNVGIGTIAPTTALDVNGQIRMQGGNPGVGKVLTSDADGVATWENPTGSSISGTENILVKFGVGGSGAANSQLLDNGTNVGIGTNDPQQKLDVLTTGLNAKSGDSVNINQITMRIRNDNNTNATGIALGFSQSSASNVTGAAIMHERISSQSTGKLHFATRGDNNVLTGIPIRMTINSNGNVGVGNTEPNRKLVVTRSESGVTSNANTAIVAEAASNNYVSILTPATNESGVLFGNTLNSADGGLIYNNGNRRSMQIRTRGNLTRVEIDSFGNMGVGTSSPISRIDARDNSGNFVLLNLDNTSTTGDRSSLIRLKSGNTTTSNVWLQGIGGTSNGLGLTNNQFYIENAGKGARMVIDTNGRVGFGTNTPNTAVVVNGGIKLGSSTVNSVEAGRLMFSETINSDNDTSYCGVGFAYNGSTDILRLQNVCGTGTKANIMGWHRSGNKVSIGNVTSLPGSYRLYVEGGIMTERLKVAVNNSANWADYVFADNYKLMPLEDVEAFVKEYKHLPNVPSAEQMVETGIDVATMDAKFMEKIEELTLYLIELKKEIKTLKAENEAIKANYKK